MVYCKKYAYFVHVLLMTKRSVEVVAMVLYLFHVTIPCYYSMLLFHVTVQHTITGTGKLLFLSAIISKTKQSELK